MNVSLIKQREREKQEARKIAYSNISGNPLHETRSFAFKIIF